MSLFQHSVLNKYLKDANQDEMKSAYKRLVLFFQNSEIQQNIRESKEEQFQEGFLTSLFVEVLGYTINPNPDFNLTTEFKNERGAKKADGAILQNGAAIAVIELKSTKTKDLESIRLQAFDYKANQHKCVYVITSNFEKVRFYINNAVDFEEFDLFKLKYEDFQLLWLCLEKENLLNGVPLAIKEASILKEENITKQIYVDYSLFKRELYSNLIANNLELEIFSGKEEKDIKLLLFKKSQKLLDRFLFIFFGEDRGLLPPNSISQILTQWEQLTELDEYKPLYSRYQKYFNYLNKGWKGKKYEIFAYNGGLFAPDEILDSIIISDEVLQKHTKVLTAYDFETDVDVNILGHIFENSLGEIENVQAAIAATGGHAPLSEQRAVSKRKKDGVFYTPKYITKYIVENTVGKLCDEKKTELGIEESEYLKSRKGRTTKKLKELDEKLVVYRNWLLTLTICDPACGSGAFLNQALDFLIREHHYIDEIKAKLLDVPMIFMEVENSILENNIFGVDINEESVEIAKLSLWLRTAQKGRKLTTLSNNIKCGNSLIDDPEIAGEKAFNWQNEFPDVFRKKKKQIWHITTATHNSRYSQRMFDNHVSLGKAVWLSEKEELIVTQTIADIAGSDELNILEYNICGDHFHLLLVCEEDEVPKIVQKIKSMSARKCNIEMGRTTPRTREHAPASSAESTNVEGEHAPRRGKTQAHLWTQKFGCKKVTSDKQQENTINYIKSNRNKHQLPENKELQSIIPKMLCTRQHAFRTEYSGGFDVVIGNPPYVSFQNISKTEKNSFAKNYKSASGKFDLYVVFLEKGILLLNDKGYISFIMPNKFLLSNYGEGLKEIILQKNIIEIADFKDKQLFEGATTYPCIITIHNFGKNKSFNYVEVNKELQEIKGLNYDISIDKLNTGGWHLGNIGETDILKRISNFNPLGLKCKTITQGIRTGKLNIFFNNIDLKSIKELKLEQNLVHKCFTGKNVKKYASILSKNNDLILYPYTNNSPVNIEDYPNCKNYLLKYKEDLHYRKDSGKIFYETNKLWFEYWDPKYMVFDSPKIVFPDISKENNFFLDNEGIPFLNTCYSVYLIDSSQYLPIISILNSKLFFFYISKVSPSVSGGYFRYKTGYIEKFGIPEISNTFIQSTSDLVSEIQIVTTNFFSHLQSFGNFIKHTIKNNILSKKLQNWHNLEFVDFIKELNKAIKASNKQRDNGTRPIELLTKTDEMEWMELFETKKAEAQNLKSEMDKTDREIDKMVYELYELTDEEIRIVEGAGR